MKISACVITKNEEKNIVKWISEIKSVADELVVVDTGSTDNTVAIAQAAGAKVYNFPWINDFAAAKNFAIDQANGEWIIFLDADEYFTVSSQKNIRDVVGSHHKDKKVGGIMCRLTNIDTDHYDKIIDSMLQVRIFRNIPEIRYHGKVHENIRNSKGNKNMVFSKNIEIYHTGYSASIIRSKAERNKKIILEKQKTEGETFEVIAALMDSYNILGEYEDALKYARKAIELNMHFVGMEGHSYEILISALAHLQLRGEHTLQELYLVMDEAMEAMPEEAAFPLEKGFVLWQHKDYVSAEKYLKKGLQLRKQFEEKALKGIGITDNSRRMLPLAYEALGNINYLKGNRQQAAEYFVAGINIYRYNVGLIRGICKCLKDAEPVDIIELLCRYYDRKKDAKFVYEALLKVADYQVYSYFEKYLLNNGIDIYANDKEKRNIEEYISIGHYDSAGGIASDRLSRLYRLAIIGKEKSEMNKNIVDILLPEIYKLKANRVEIRSIDRLNKVTNTWGGDSEKNPLVSIMIPTYNRPTLFEKTLQSALAQTYGNIEIIINDNSANDETEKLMRKYIADKRIRYFRNIAAKTKEDNFMLFEKQARGSMLQWCMDDDILAPDKLKIMVQVLRDNPHVTLVTSRRGFIDKDGNDIPRSEDELLPINNEYSYYDGTMFANYTLTHLHNIIGEPSAVLFRRNDLTHHYWRAESKGLKAISDVAMWMELLEKGGLVVFRDSLSYYRRHDDQEGQQIEVVLLSRIEWFKLINEYYNRKLFITTEEDYRKGLERLYDEYNDTFKNLHQVQVAQNIAEYTEAMLKIKEILGR